MYWIINSLFWLQCFNKCKINFGLVCTEMQSSLSAETDALVETMTTARLHTWQSWLKTGLVVATICCEFISKYKWPPNSSDLGPVDYHVWWAMLERCILTLAGERMIWYLYNSQYFLTMKITSYCCTSEWNYVIKYLISHNFGEIEINSWKIYEM